jgi:Flp pilus assembly protein TadG
MARQPGKFAWVSEKSRKDAQSGSRLRTSGQTREVINKMKFLRNKGGIAVIEFAIILPLLLVILFGIIEFGILLYDKAVITNASREGARAGIVAQDPRVADDMIQTVVKNYCKNYLVTFGTDTIEDSDIVVSPAYGTRSSAAFGTDLKVDVNYHYDFFVLPNFVTALLGGINLQATTLMKME